MARHTSRSDASGATPQSWRSVWPWPRLSSWPSGEGGGVALLTVIHLAGLTRANLHTATSPTIIHLARPT